LVALPLDVIRRFESAKDPGELLAN